MDQQKLHILLVDDDTNLLSTMGDILKAKGFEPIPVRTGAAALAQVAGQAVDVALIDLQLEDMPGLELLGALQARSPGTECILLTGHASQKSAIDAINAGAFSYFQKPCDVDQLVLSIQRAGEKRAAEQALRASEERFRSLYENASLGMYRTTPDGRILMANPALLRMLGYDSFDQLARRNLEQAGYEPDYPRAQFLSAMEKDGQVNGLESAWRRQDGGTIFVRESAHLLRNDQGDPLYYDGTVEDITERKQAEEALKRAEQKYRSIFENATEGIHQTTPDGRIISVNPAGARMLGFASPEELMANAGFINTHFYVQPGRREEFKRLMETRDGISGFESEIYRKDGRTGWISENVHSVRDEHGNFLYYEGTSVDITERKQAEAALRENEERYRGAIAAAGLVPYGIDYEAGIFTFIGEDILKLTGYPAGEFTPALLKASVQESLFWGPENTALTPEEAARRFRAGEIDKWGSDLRIRTRSGEERWINDVSVPLRDEHGRVTRAIGIFQDLTGRKRVEAELRETQASEQNFAGRLAILSEVTTELSKADSLDALCRRTVELGRERLDFDRLAIWFLADDHVTMLGTFGVDEQGRFTDERSEHFPIGPDFPNWPLLDEETPLLHLTDATLALKGEVVGRGEHVSAGLWDGKAIIGYISLDNLLRQRPFSDRDCEIIRLYASALGHLISLKRTETELQASQASERDFAGRLTILLETTTELSKMDDLEALCRRAVELGRERLDFDRLAIWFLAADKLSMQGTFGVDAEGRITDEHAARFSMGPDSPTWPVLQGQVPLLRLADIPLSLAGEVVGQGMRVAAGLWDGKTVIGFISVDNLLRQRPFSDRDCEIIRLYASALGHLISIKRAGVELRSSEERYRMLADNMTDTVWLMDLDLKTTYISPSVLRLRGYSLDELNTVPLDRQMAPESFARLAKIFKTELAHKRLAQPDLPISATLELELYRKDGSAFWSENMYTLIRDPRGQALAILGSGRDITEGKKAREALQNSEKRFRALIENSTDAIVLVDPRGRVFYESPAYGRMTGRDPRQRIGMSSFEYVHPEDKPTLARVLNQLVQSPGGVAQATFRSEHKDGAWRWLEATATNLLGESAVQAVVINLHDVTETRQAGEALQTTERIYRQAITRAGGVPYQRDYSANAYMFLGEGIQDLTGYPPEEMNGDLFGSRLRQIEPYGEHLDLPEEERIRLARLPGAAEEWREDYLFERKDGSLVWLADHSVPVNASDGKSIGSLGILMDITQRKQAEKSIRRQLAELEVLYETGLSISRLLEPKEIGRKIIETLTDKLSWRHASVRLFHPETQRLELLVFNRPGLDTQQLQSETRRLNKIISKPGEGFSGWVVQHGQSIRSGNVAADPRFILTFKDIQSGLYVPMQVGERTIGVIGAESDQPEAFSEADERLLKTLAAQAGIAMENARLLAETLRQVEELGTLADVSSALRAAVTRPEIVAVILDQLMMSLFHADSACLVAPEPVSGANLVEAARGGWLKKTGLRLKPAEGLSGLMAETLMPYQSDAEHPDAQPIKSEFSDRPEALAGAPLLVQGLFIGSLWVGRAGRKKAESPLPFNPDEIRMLTSVANLAANALQRASMHALALRRADELLKVNTMGRLLAETLDLDLIYEKLDEGVWQLLEDISLVAISLYDSDKRQLTCVRYKTETGLVDVRTLPVEPLEPPDNGTQSEAIHTRQPVIINNLRERLKTVSSIMEGRRQAGQAAQSGLYVPMLAQGRVIGVMQVQSTSLNRFGESDAGLLSLVANTAAADIENARLFAETQKQVHNLAALHEIDTAISASVDIHVTLNILLEQTISELKVDAAAVLLVNPVARTLEYAVSQGFRNHQVNGSHVPIGAGLVGQAALRRQIQSASDLQEDLPALAGQAPTFNIYDGEGFVVHHAIPLVVKGQVQGVLEVFQRSPFQPDDDWFAFLETLSRQAAIAIDNNNLFDSLQRSNTNIVLAYDATIQGWSQALDLRDKETEGHTQRVTELTVKLARLIGVPDGDLEHIRRGTLLHDIGKMGIPDAILLKPDKLTEAEWVIMRQHPVFAYEMLSSIAYLRPALDIPHYHHEKWDGTGYPDGLKGAQIPLYARIFAIVDVYDALTNDRPYRPAWSNEKTLEHIRAESGKHFDPAIVEAFLNMLARGN